MCQSRFSIISTDPSRVRKTNEENELIFLKILAYGFKGILPITFLLKSLEVVSPTAHVMLYVMIDAYHTYFSNDCLEKQVTCSVANQVSVNLDAISEHSQNCLS